jgi:hypothetical protein
MYRDPKVKVFDGKGKYDNLLKTFGREEATVSPVRSGSILSVKRAKDLIIGQKYQSYNKNHKPSFIYEILSAPYLRGSDTVIDVLRDGKVKETIFLTDYSVLPYGANRWSFNYLVRLY